MELELGRRQTEVGVLPKIVQIVGAGLAGCAAAIAARREGSHVLLYEKSPFPRHKVCGEYLSPEIVPVLQDLGLWDDFQAANPAPIRRLVLHFRNSQKRSQLRAAAYGLSRYALDDLMLRRAISVGVRHEPAPAPALLSGPVVLAHGRQTQSTKGTRLFGFKSHFEGPVNDAVELFFFGQCYVGVNPVEGGVTNVCGLGPEELLRAHDFDIDRVAQGCPQLAARLQPLRRKMKWLTVGPLVFANRFRAPSEPDRYPAGDALSFVDPFTGSGMLSALTMGRLAGIAAARGTAVEEYVAECRRRLEKPFQFSAVIRAMLANGWAERLSAVIPAHLLVRLTRTHRAV